jgi:hypothetical protein
MSNPNCKGSYKLGTACGDCPRCQAKNYGPTEREAAIAAEAERTKDLPADRVKKSQRIKIEEN